MKRDIVFEASARLEQFADWTGTDAPRQIVDDERILTVELLEYCRREGVSLTWLFSGGVREVVLAYRRERLATEG